MIFTVTPAPDGRPQYTSDGHYPVSEARVVTDDTGDFSINLVVDIRYSVGLAGSWIYDPNTNTTFYPRGTIFEIVVPPGDGSISLGAILALGGIEP